MIDYHTNNNTKCTNMRNMESLHSSNSDSSSTGFFHFLTIPTSFVILSHTSRAGSLFALAPSYPNIQWGMSSLRLRNDGATRGGRGEGRRDGMAERNIVIWIHFGAILNLSWPPNLPVPPIFYPRPPSLGFLWGAILIMAREPLVSPGSERSFQHITTDGLHYIHAL